jgi:hypothetical protein
MRTLLVAVVAATVAWSVGGLQPDRALAAEGVPIEKRVVAPRISKAPIIESSCRAVWRCGPLGGCGWRRVCTSRCADGWSCYPLYGAYGPYGGLGYWAGYTASGWGPP